MNRLFVLLFALLTVSAGCVRKLPPSLSGDDLPPPFSEEAVNFLVFGDWGRNGFFNQRDVARQMGITAQEIDSEFVISTGDNFYPSGVRDIDDSRWQTSFELIYTAESLQKPWYVVLGNHDWEGNIDAEIEYTERSDRWEMPDRYFTEELNVNDSTKALFVFIDTTPIVDAARTRHYPQSNRWSQSRQLAWIDSTLASSNAAWKIVVGHHPVYVASSKYEDDPNLIRDLAPILNRYHVQAYFSGHDHNLQHLRVAESDVNYFVSGAGSLTRAVDPGDPHSLFALRIPGFMAVSLTAEEMYVKALGENGFTYYFANVPVGDLPQPDSTSDGSARATGSGSR